VYRHTLGLCLRVSCVVLYCVSVCVCVCVCRCVCVCVCVYMSCAPQSTWYLFPYSYNCSWLIHIAEMIAMCVTASSRFGCAALPHIFVFQQWQKLECGKGKKCCIQFPFARKSVSFRQLVLSFRFTLDALVSRFNLIISHSRQLFSWWALIKLLSSARVQTTDRVNIKQQRIQTLSVGAGREQTRAKRRAYCLKSRQFQNIIFQQSQP